MSDDPIGLDTEDGDDLAAAECALGLLDGPERDAAHRRRLREPRFDRAVEAWEDRLAGLIDPIDAVSPPPLVWSAIQKQVGSSGAVVELRLRRSLAAWRAAAAGAASIAAALVVALIWPHPPSLSGKGPLVASTQPSGAHPGQPGLERVMAARMVSATGPAVFIAVVDPKSHVIVVTPASIAPAPGRSPELWLIPAGGKPIALGLAAFGRSVRLSPDVDFGGSTHATLAVSMEPLGGSPTGQPTGPVVASGALEHV